MNIIVDLDYQIQDGAEVVFRSPVDCSMVTGLLVNHIGGSQEFAFADAHGNNVGDINNLFAENVVVKVILDVTTGMAFVQNADTNAYLEEQLAGKAPAGYGIGSESKQTTDLNKALIGGIYFFSKGAANFPGDLNFGAGVVFVKRRGNANIFQTATDIYGRAAERIGTYNSASGAWSFGSWKQIDSSMFAPSGYGIGGASKEITDANQALTGGIYYYTINAGVQNLPKDVGNGVIFVETRGDTNVFQTLTDIYSVTVKRVCTYDHQGTWKFGPWEYVNPPMYYDREYRTVERFGNDKKPVYVKSVYMGNLNVANKAAVMNVGTPDVEYIIECHGSTRSGKSLPKTINGHITLDCLKIGDSISQIAIVSEYDATFDTAVATIKYTKQNDYWF